MLESTRAALRRHPLPASRRPSAPGANPMLLHADLHERVVLDTASLDWTPSPVAGVERRLLERDGAEVARATSIVRYAPGTRYARHTHGGGEEILVLDGTLSDEHGHYPAGTYLRSPPGSSHAPFSTEGCTLLVKLRQMAPGETARLVVDTRQGEWRGPADGVQRLLLHAGADDGERVQLVRFAPGAAVEGDLHTGGEELLVLAGVLEDEHGRYPTGTWLRQPHGSRHSPHSAEGCTLFVKRGHLPH
jgi:anti-sigma factor ChrR (cupin superfamily)